MSEKTIVQVWLETDGEAPVGGRAPFYYVETDYPDHAAFLEAVDTDRLIRGVRLDSRWSAERDVRLVHRRSLMSFRGGAVRRADAPYCRFTTIEGAS